MLSVRAVLDRGDGDNARRRWIRIPRKSVDITNLHRSLSVRTEVRILRAEGAWFMHNSDSFETALVHLADTNDSRLVVRTPCSRTYSIEESALRIHFSAGHGDLPTLLRAQEARSRRDARLVRGVRFQRHAPPHGGGAVSSGSHVGDCEGSGVVDGRVFQLLRGE